MGEVLGMTWEEARPWILLLVACHDLGKACPGFQAKWTGSPVLLKESDLKIPAGVDTNINHAFVSQVALQELLTERGWAVDLAELAADAVGCHHGTRASSTTLEHLEGNRKAIGDTQWANARRSLFKSLLDVFQPGAAPATPTLSGPDFMLLSGLTCFSDWIGSNEDWFPFGTTDDCNDLSSWWSKRRRLAQAALTGIGWEPRDALATNERPFEEIFGFAPRPLQVAVADAVRDVSSPCIILIEAPMGEGKTEAALHAHLELQRRFGHRGMYVALPSKATGNAMFDRTLKFLHNQRADRQLDLQLVHGAKLLNDTFQKMRPSGIHDPDRGGDVRASEWFTNKKRALLSEYGVGTVDQALLTILPVRHYFVRLWGLANRVVVFDEIHAYDAYTGTLLIHLIRWLLSLGSSVILLSATLPPTFRRRLAEVVGTRMPDSEETYPRLSIFQTGGVTQTHFEADPERRLIIHLKGITPDLPSLRSALEERLVVGGMALALVNTVQRAQDLYKLFPDGERLLRDGQPVGKRLPDGTEVLLFHARFPSDRKQKREDHALKTFGEKGTRQGKKILIATQVAEQSLDLDFDLIVTDLAPIDLLLQRAGRLWRHKRANRPISEPYLLVAGLAGEEPPSFENPVWWSFVYREDLLLRTWSLLRNRQSLTFPDEIDTLVRVVYEEEIEVPKSLQERMGKASEKSEGKAFAYKGQANQAIIGFPDDASWNDPSRYIKADDDEPGLHPTLIAQTRLGEPSVVAIPIFHDEEFSSDIAPGFAQAKSWFLRSVNITRIGVVKPLQALGIPEGWKKSPLVRNCYPLVLDSLGRWKEDTRVRLDDDLGIVYEPKETT